MIDIIRHYQTDAGPLMATLQHGGLTREEAEDVAAETWLRAWRDRDRLREPLWPWLRTVALRQAIDRTRRQQHHPAVPLDWEMLDNMSVERLVMGYIASDELCAAINRLPEAERAAVGLRALEWSYAEIAEGLGCTARTVRVRACRGRHRVAVMLAGGVA